MARKKQQLINYHTGSLTSMPLSGDVQLGEIVVRHATDKPELLIKKDNNEFATFIDSTSISGKLETLKAYIDGQIDSLESASTRDLKAFSATVVSTYATSADTVAAIGAVDTKLTRDYATSANTVAAIDAVNSSVTGLSANVHTRIESLETGLTNTINEKVARAYRYHGSCTYAELPESGSVIGEVWNVTDANGNYPAGTNYAWNGTEWDALGGSVDLSPYATSANVKTEIDGIKQTVATYATKDELKSTSGSIITAYTNAIAAAKKEATDASSAYTDTQIAAAYSSATTAAAASAETLQNNINTVNNSVTGLSASTVSIETTANSAIQTASIVDKDTCKVSVDKKGTELQFDFRNLVIDCGDF